jgi:hypothetical protein
MLPEKIRREIGSLIVDAYSNHQEEIAELMQPIILRSMRDVASVVQDDLTNAITVRAKQVDKLRNRYQTELVEKRIVPLVEDEILPILQVHGEPLAKQIGSEIWQRASVFRFGWRYLYDRSPLPEKNLLATEFERFVRYEAIPIVRNYLPDIVRTQQAILREVSQNEKVQAVVSEMIHEVAQDEEFQDFVADILRDVFVDNDRLQEAIRKNWESPDAQAALAITNMKLDPTITEIGATLFGSPDTRITPEFSRVMRNKIMFKDDRWLVLHLSGERQPDATRPTVITVRTGRSGAHDPFNSE